MKRFGISSTAAVVAVVALAGCSSSSDDSNNGTPQGSDGGAQASCPSTAGGLSVTEATSQINGTNTCILSGTMTSDFTMTSDTVWVLDDVVKVGEGNGTLADAAAVAATKAAGPTLTIEAGTDIRATNDAVLLVTRGSEISAVGTVNSPITFSSLDDGYDGEAEWGGVVIQGFARHAAAGTSVFCDNAGAVCNVAGEGGTFIGNFGGSDDADNSGTLNYVRIAEGGLVAGPDNEVNGLTLQGVGHGTSIEYVQVHNNRDDGVEWFGGTVNAKYLVLTNNDDDDIDFDEGYRGNIQHAIVVKNQTKAAPSGLNDPRAIEANSSGADSVDLTEATISNVTIVGSALVQGDNSQPGMRLRGDVTVNLFNTAVSAYGECFELDQGANTNAGETTIAFTNFIGACGATFSDVEAGVAFTQSNVTNTTNSALTFDSVLAVTSPDASLLSAPSITATDNGSGFVFDSTAYIGAVDNDTNNANRGWWAGWTIPDTVPNLAPVLVEVAK